ncbi:hypothetical protein HOY82DRAFT_325395 [Tuber indicum]|nr:hypothetical protein HOY82DRAFT_325395 [Tuber indicum]
MPAPITAMATAKYGDEDIRRGIPRPSQDIERIHRTELDDYIGFVLNHHGAGGARAPPQGDAPDMQNVNEESFFYRNCWIPKNIQVPRYVNGVPSGNQSNQLEGEEPVTFYNYSLDGGKFEYVVMPLQYLYKNYGEAMVPKESSSMNPLTASRENEVDELVQQNLQIMEFPACYYAKDFLRAFSSEHIWRLRDRGDSLRPGVSFKLALGSPQFTLAISIPYLGVEKNVRLPTQDIQALSDTDAVRFIGMGRGRSRLERSEVLRRLERLEELTDFRKHPYLSWPRESATLDQSRYSNTHDDSLEDHGVGKDLILVHHTGIILLNTSSRGHGSDKAERLAIFRSCDDKNSGRVPLLPHQKSVNALDAFLNVLSNTLKSSEQAVIDDLRRKASDYSWDFQRFAKGSGATGGDIGGKLMSSSATLSDEFLAVIDVVKSQQRYIKDLRGFLTGLGAGADRPNGLPLIPGQWGEERSVPLKRISFLLEERQTFLDEVNEIFTGVKVIKKSFYQLSTLKTSKDMANSTGLVMQNIREGTTPTGKTRGQVKRSRKAWWKAWWKRNLSSWEKYAPLFQKTLFPCLC